MPATLTTVNSIMKEIYEGQIQEQLQSEVVGLRRIEDGRDGTVDNVGGKYVTFPVRVRRNQGLGSRQELEQLPTGGQQGYASVRIGLKFAYGRLRISGPTMELAENNTQAFASAMTEEMSGLKSDVVKDTGRQFYGSGNGALAVETADAANTVTVASTQYLEVGQVIDLVSAVGAVQAANRTITAINTATNVVTYDGADVSGVTAPGTLIVRQGSGPVSAVLNREVNGLTSIVAATGALYNIDPATEPVWASIVDANGGTPRPLAETLMITMVDRVRVNGGKTSVIFTSLGVRRAYFNLLQAQRRFTEAKEFPGGFKGLTFAGGDDDIPVVSDVDAPANTMWGLQESSIKVYRDKKWHFANADGTVWKWVHDFDAWEAVLRQYWEIGVKRRNANWRLSDVTEN